MNQITSRSRLTQAPSQQEAISPQSLLYGTERESWKLGPAYPTPVTERFFEAPPLATAHTVVRWAYNLSWVSLISVSILLAFLLADASNAEGKLSSVAIYAAFWGMILWTNRGLRQGRRAAWYLQIPLSLLSLFSCSCVGLFLYGYILTQWFKPEVKAWFDLH